MHRTQIYLTELQSKKLKHVAVDLNISVSELLRRLIQTYLEKSDHEIFDSLEFSRKDPRNN
ncbi:ribbon-helix-helix protein, CopG family [Candidatus Pacearchaeota archaeon]|nr:ribbon-helix-helix protein, CopG family [Candidatus Pacearchaeota archaeon]